MHKPQRAAAATPRPNQQMYGPNSQLPSSLPPRQPALHQPQPQRLQPHTPQQQGYYNSASASSTAHLNNLPPPSPIFEMDESMPSSQPQYASQFRPQSALGNTTTPSRVPDSYRSGLNGYANNNSPGNGVLVPSSSGSGLRPSPAQRLHEHQHQLHQMQLQQQEQQQQYHQERMQPQPEAKGSKASDKVIHAVNELGTAIHSVQGEQRTQRDMTHDIRTNLQALPTTEDVKEILRDILSPAMYEQLSNIKTALKEAVAMLPEQTAQLALEKVRALGLGVPSPGPSSSNGGSERLVTLALEQFITALGPVTELNRKCKDLEGLPEALKMVAVFQGSMELLHQKVDKVRESQEVVAEVAPTQRRQGGDLSRDILNAIHRTEERIDSIEERLASIEPQLEMSATLKKLAEDVAFLRNSVKPSPPSRTPSQLDQLANAAAYVDKMNGTSSPNVNGTSITNTSFTRSNISPSTTSRPNGVRFHEPHHDARQRARNVFNFPPAFASPELSPSFNARHSVSRIMFRENAPPPMSRMPSYQPTRYEEQAETLFQFPGRPVSAVQDSETLYQHDALRDADHTPSAVADTSPASNGSGLPTTPSDSPILEPSPPTAPKPKKTYQRKNAPPLEPSASALSLISSTQDLFGPVVPAPADPAPKGKKRKAPASAAPAATQPQPAKKPPPKKRAPRAKTAAQPKVPAPPEPQQASPPAPKKRRAATRKAPPAARAESPVPREVINLTLDDSLNSITPPREMGRTRSETRRGTVKAEPEDGFPGFNRGVSVLSVIDTTDGDALIGLD